MPRKRWALTCTAHRTNGEPCSAWAVTGAYVCVKHGGLAPQVRAAAARRWEHELIMRRVERDFERKTGKPLDPLLSAFIRYRASADIATWRRHVRTRPLEDAEAAGG